MTMKRFTRLVACFLASVMLFSLLPVPRAQASQEVRPVEVPVRDKFDGETSVARMAVQDGRYYISIEEAANMLNIHKTGRGYITDHGYFTVDMSTKKLEWVKLGDTRCYALEDLMNQLETTVYSLGDGVLGYNSVPKNKDRLCIETENVFLDRVNSADWVENDWLEGFGIVYDWLRKRRLEAIWGDATRDDLKDLMAEMIQFKDSEPAFLKKVEEGYDAAVFAAGLIEKGDKKLPKALNIMFGDDLGKMILEKIQDKKLYKSATATAKTIKVADGSGTFTEFFCEMSGLPASQLRNAPEMPKLNGIGLGDILSTAIYLSGISRASSQYADAMDNVLNWYDDCDLKFAELERQMAEGGKEVVSDYQALAAKKTGTAVLRAAANLLEEVPENTTVNLLDELLIGKASLVSTVIDIVDSLTLRTMEKNTAVKTAAFCRFIQHWLDKLYFSARKDAPDRLLLYRDAAMLYLKAGWLSYDAIPDGDATEAVAENFKAMFQDKIASLTKYDEADFHFEKNEDRLKAGGQGTELAPPPWDYMNFINSWKWLDYVDYKYEYPEQVRGQYYIHDVDKDGSQDVIISSGVYSGAMIFQCFSRKQDGIVLLGQGDFSELEGNFLSGHDDIPGLMCSGFTDGACWNCYYGIKSGRLDKTQEEKYQQGEQSRLYTDFWYPLGGKVLPRPPQELKNSSFDPDNILGVTLGYGIQWSFYGTRPMFPDGTEEEQRMFTQDYRACFTFYEDGTLDFFLYVPYGDYKENCTGTYTVKGDDVTIRLRCPDDSYMDCTYRFNSHDISFKQLSKQGVEYAGKKGEVYQLEQYPWEDPYYGDFDGEVYDEHGAATEPTQPKPKPKPEPSAPTAPPETEPPVPEPEESNILAETLGYGRQWSFLGARPWFPDGDEELQKKYIQNFRVCFTFYGDGTLDFYFYIPHSILSSDDKGSYVVEGDRVEITLEGHNGVRETFAYRLDPSDISFEQVTERGAEPSGKRGDVYQLEPYPWEDPPAPDYSGGESGQAETDPETAQSDVPAETPRLPETDYAELLGVDKVWSIGIMGYQNDIHALGRISYVFYGDGRYESMLYYDKFGVMQAFTGTYTLSGDEVTISVDGVGYDQYYKIDPEGQQILSLGNAKDGRLDQPDAHTRIELSEEDPNYDAESFHEAVTAFLAGQS